jgi:uncharacterized protein (TIGR03435 family)
MAMVAHTTQSQSGSDWQTAAGGKRAFEAASVKESPTFKPPKFPLGADDAYVPGETLSASMPMYFYVAFAYKLSSQQVEKLVSQNHLPAWTRDGPPFFAIEARAAGRPTKDQMRLMMQALLADRFKLAAHFETTDGPVFALTLVKPGRTGPNLRPHSQGAPCPESAIPSISTPRQIRDGEAFPMTCGFAVNGRKTSGARIVGFRDSTSAQLAETISTSGSMTGEVNRPVVDQTGLVGAFDFTIEWMPGEDDLFVRTRPPGADVQKDAQPDTSFVVAMREQLGLKLTPSKGPIQTLLIDHIQKPSEN